MQPVSENFTNEEQLKSELFYAEFILKIWLDVDQYDSIKLM